MQDSIKDLLNHTIELTNELTRNCGWPSDEQTNRVMFLIDDLGYPKPEIDKDGIISLINGVSIIGRGSWQK